MAYHYTSEELQKKAALSFLQSNDGKEAHPPHSKIPLEQLQEAELAIKGKIVYPWSPDYNESRADFNNVYPAFPELIVYVSNYDDIKECLKLAHDFHIWTVIRSGGHSLAGYSVCDGMIIDMSLINNVHVDVDNKTAFVEAGTTFHKLVPILESNNLHVPTGGCPGVAVAGYMMGGGYSLTSRTFGMQCDRVMEVTVMLADGSIVVANSSQYQDLLWAICGGTGGNFGVLLSMKFSLVTLGKIFGVRLSWTFEDPEGYQNAACALSTIQNEYALTQNYNNLGIETIICRDYDVNIVSDMGVKKVYFCASWVGTETDFEAALAPLLCIPGITVDVPVTEGMFSEINLKVLDGTPPLTEGIKAFSRSGYLAKALSQADWVNILEKYSTAPNRYTMIDLECYGGVINQVPVLQNAFIHRNVTMDCYIDAFFNDQTNDQATNEVWIENFYTFIRQYSNGHSYQNYPNRNQTDYKWAFWGKAYTRLQEIKQKYDPNNFFHYEQSIVPSRPSDMEGAVKI